MLLFSHLLRPVVFYWEIQHLNAFLLYIIYDCISPTHWYEFYIILRAAGVDLQSQEAYDMAVEGLLRPMYHTLGPTIYNTKRIYLDPPYFRLGVYALQFKYYPLSNIL